MIECPICRKWFKPLGYPRHRAMHYEEAEELKREKIQVESEEELWLENI